MHPREICLASVPVAATQANGAARDNTAKREELSGSTITITSLGKYGGIASTPVINLPEVAIIGVNKAVERPVVVNGQVVIRPMMYVAPVDPAHRCMRWLLRWGGRVPG